LKVVRSLPKTPRDRIGYELFRLQAGETPTDSKAMPSIGRGVFEIRVHHEGEYRVLYANILECVVVLHAFAKKSQKTAKADLALGKDRLRKVLQEIAHGTFRID